MSDAELL